jgi:hypothetical protein
MSPVEILLGVAFPVLIGLALALAMGSGGAAEFWIARVASIAAAVDLFGLMTWWLYKSHFSVWNYAIGSAIAVCIVVILPEVMKWIDGKEIATTLKADVSLKLVYPEAPALVLINNSETIARDIKWTVILLNMDLPDRNDPLPIPTTTFDWLRPRSHSAPQNLFSAPPVAQLLQPGNRLFGSASVICAGCSRGRTYIVYIVWDQGGWFAEIEDEKSGEALIPKNFLKHTRMEYFDRVLAAVQILSRTPIDQPEFAR